MPFNNRGSNRERIQFTVNLPNGGTGQTNPTNSQRDALIRANVLLVDPRRQRPSWFDGRFLAARDLANEQNYFLTRQADLGRAGGFGVVEGLRVTEIAGLTVNSERLQIEAGHGVTDTGELVVLRDAIVIDPTNIPEIQTLDASFGLRAIPNEPGRTRTGIYVLALRAVEWTANPISAYPTSLTGQRTVEDGDVIEGVAITLIPFPDTGEGTWTRRRARAARTIFLEGEAGGALSGTLPLALVALRGNLVEWVDPFMVRRDAGAERPVGQDFGFGNRALREAHLVQYDRHLSEVVTANAGQPFAASQFFDVLPPVGRVPSNTFIGNALSQQFFPPGVAVDLSFIPEDELPAIIEESLSLPPLDLTLAADALAGTGVVVVIPLTRAAFNLRRVEFAGATRRLRSPQLISQAKATPIDLLINRSQTFALANPPVVPVTDPVEILWRTTLTNAIAAQPVFWFVRRRHLPVLAVQTPGVVNAFHARRDNPGALLRTAESDPIVAHHLMSLRAMERPEIDAVTRGLNRRAVAENPALLRSLLEAATTAAKKEKSPAAALAVLAPLADPNFGQGLDRLAADDIEFARAVRDLPPGSHKELLEIDRLARTNPTAPSQKAIKSLSARVARVKRAAAPQP